MTKSLELFPRHIYTSLYTAGICVDWQGQEIFLVKCELSVYIISVIKNFKSRKLKRLYDGDRSVSNPEWIEKMENILFYLDNAETPQALNLPGYRLHSLKGNLKGFWSVSVSGNWRIIFRFENGHACDVDFIDYH